MIETANSVENKLHLCLLCCELVALQVTEPLSAVIVFGHVFFWSTIIAIHGIQAGANSLFCPWTHNWRTWGRLPQWQETLWEKIKDSFGWSRSQKKKWGRNMFWRLFKHIDNSQLTFASLHKAMGVGFVPALLFLFTGTCGSPVFLLCLLPCFTVPNITWGSRRKHVLTRTRSVSSSSTAVLHCRNEWVCALHSLTIVLK